MSFIIMQLALSYYSLGVTISFCKFCFENDTLIQVRYCHLIGIWYVDMFIVDMLLSSFFCDSAHIYVDIYLTIFGIRMHSSDPPSLFFFKRGESKFWLPPTEGGYEKLKKGWKYGAGGRSY